MFPMNDAIGRIQILPLTLFPDWSKILLEKCEWQYDGKIFLFKFTKIEIYHPNNSSDQRRMKNPTSFNLPWSCKSKSDNCAQEYDIFENIRQLSWFLETSNRSSIFSIGRWKGTYFKCLTSIRYFLVFKYLSFVWA